MKKQSTIFLWLFLCGITTGFSQELLPHLHDTTSVGNQINVVGNGFVHSSNLQNRVTQKLLFGGHIEDDVISAASKKHQSFNRIGGTAKMGIDFRSGTSIFKNHPDWSWMVNVEEVVYANGTYRDGVFGLLFEGNEKYIGEEVSLSKSHFTIDQFLSIGGGFHHQKTNTFVTVNLILPQQFMHLNMDRGSMTFYENEEDWDVDMEGDLLLANKKNYFKGLGFAFNFDYYVPFGDTSGFNGIIGIVGRNLGAYQIHKGRAYNMDVKTSYNGYEISEWMNEENSMELMDTLGITEGTESRFRLLPGYLQVGKVVSKNATHQLQSFFGVRMYANRVYRPMVYLGLHYQPIQEFSFGGQVSVGGYGNVRVGLYANYSTDQFIAGLGTEDILGAILGKQFGYSGLIRLGWRF